jgi:hypothetical protein
VSGAFFNGKWTGIDRYLLKLSDVNKDTQEVSVFGATAKVTETFLKSK